MMHTLPWTNGHLTSDQHLSDFVKAITMLQMWP
jgi:hypothetical protein